METKYYWCNKCNEPKVKTELELKDDSVHMMIYKCTSCNHQHDLPGITHLTGVISNLN